MKLTRIALMFLAWSVWPCLTARATSVLAPAFPELVAESALIARVEVAAVTCAWVEAPGHGRVIKTFVRFNVRKVLKGSADATLELSFLGGEVDGQGMRVQGMPEFRVGQHDLLFVGDRGGVRACPLVGLMHGRYRVVTDPATGRDTVARNDRIPLESVHDVQLPQDGNVLVNRTKSITRALSLADFEQSVSTAVAGAASSR